LLQGLILSSQAPPAAEVVRAAIDHRLLLVPAGPQVVRIVPPLTIRKRELRKLARRLEKTLNSFL
jgi:acetylornithine aminotransferase